MICTSVGAIVSEFLRIDAPPKEMSCSKAMNWHPISTLKLHPSKCSSFEEVSDEVMLWAGNPRHSGDYMGPIVGQMRVYHRPDGTSFVSVHGAGFGGYEWEWDFREENVTHWAELPKGPGE
jgi:hypothetical protein